MIHVLHVVPMLAVGGMELALARVIRGLSVSPFEHSVACLSGQARIAEKFGCTVAIHCLNGESNAVGALLRLRRLIQNLQPSVIHARNVSAWLDVAAVRMSLRRRPPLVLSFHGTDHVGPLPRRWRLMAAIEPSRDFLARSLGRAQSRIAIIPNGIDTQRFAPDVRPIEPDRRLVVGTVGNLSPVKNQALLVRACAELLLSGHPIELRVAGEGPEREPIAQLAARLGISDYIRLAGHVSDVPGFLKALDLFVLPSDSEAHPNALIEAMACGLPCIASRVGGIPDVLRDDSIGRMFDRGDLGGLVKIMSELLVAPDTRAALGRGARKRAEERYGLDDMIRRYAALYSDVASR
jgi:glycosyltransferase involved in cell wall biosynthesis